MLYFKSFITYYKKAFEYFANKKYDYEKIEQVFNTESIPSNDEYIDKVNDTKAFNLMLENQFECFDVLRKKSKVLKLLQFKF